jgi:hypothetical protein
MLTAREQEIDDLIEKTKVQGYSTFIQLFTSGFNYMSALFMSSAMRGQTLLGAHLTQSLSVNEATYEQNGQQLRGSKSNDGYFMQNDLIDEDDHDSSDFEQSNEMRRRQQRAKSSKKSAPSSTKSSYDLLDAEILLQDEEIEEIGRKSANKNVSKRRTNKTNEASKYGTITRGKSSKSRTVITHSNDSDQ